MIKRSLYNVLQNQLLHYPAVALMGPRQVGKTTLAHTIEESADSVYLDLENPRDLNKVQDIELFHQNNEGKLIILDEVQRVPELFASIRGIIDQQRRQGHRTGQFLFLGSASIDLLKQSSETLAGRIAYLELSPLSVLEVGKDANLLWLRGGFPDSYLADSDERSLDWRNNFISAYLERDIPQLGPRIPAETLRRFWTMLAHNQGGTLNASNLAQGLGVSGQTVARYLDLLVDLLLVRRLQPWVSNTGKRLVKSPKVYVRDSGVVHALLGLEVINELLGHPVVGGSWEGFVIENLHTVLPKVAQSYFYRSSGGSEIDLIIAMKPDDLWAIEIKRSLSPKVSKGFYRACDDLNIKHRFVVYPGEESWSIAKDTRVISLSELMQLISSSPATGTD